MTKAETVEDVRVYVNPNGTKFIQRVRLFMRAQHKSWSTEKTYIHWIKRFIYFHNKRHPIEMGANEVKAFLNDLAISKNCSPATQALALNALCFLYNQFLQKELKDLDFHRAKARVKIPVVFTRTEAKRVIDNLKYPHSLIARILYGSGLRLNECLSLRVKDIDFGMKQILVMQGKGNK